MAIGSTIRASAPILGQAGTDGIYRMKRFSDHINKFRIKEGLCKSDDSYGMIGTWVIPYKLEELCIISSDGMDWEHVSVSLEKRCPTWEEMCFIKDLFWNDDEVVIQLHPAKKDYINQYNNCLHLWRPIRQSIPMPPKIMIGVQ
jgi:hypothetical protein